MKVGWNLIFLFILISLFTTMNGLTLKDLLKKALKLELSRTEIKYLTRYLTLMNLIQSQITPTKLFSQ